MEIVNFFKKGLQMRKVLLLALLLLLPASFACGAAKIGILTKDLGTGDVSQLVSWSKSQGYDADTIIPWPDGQFKKQGIDAWIDLSSYNLLWLDISYDVAITVGKELPPLPAEWTDEKCKKAILAYLEKGGTLVVSTMAFGYPVDLGVESVRPNEWGQMEASLGIGYKSLSSNELIDTAGKHLVTTNGLHLWRWAYYNTAATPSKGKQLAGHINNDAIKMLVKWEVGKGRIYGLSILPWMSKNNLSLENSASLVKALYSAGGISPDAEIAKRTAEELAAQERQQKLQELTNLKLSEVSASAVIGDKAKKGFYADITKDGFVIGNESIERRVALSPAIRTVSVWNKLTDEALPTGSSEFRLTFGQKSQELNISSSDFTVVGKPTVKSDKGSSTIEVVLEKKESPSLRVKLYYKAGASPQIEKYLEVNNTSGSELFLREVWLDTVRFDEKAEVVPYTVLTAFARTKTGSLWLCQDLPYSSLSADASNRWIGVAYPPCEPLAAGAVYRSEHSYLTAAKLTGKLNQPNRLVHQISTYGPFSDPQIPLDEGEIESCTDFVDRHGFQVKESYVVYESYHDYGSLGYTDFLPYVKGPGAGFASIKQWIERSRMYGAGTYVIYPDIGAWKDVPEAHKMLADQIVPYLEKNDMYLMLWFSTYWSSWYSGVGLKDGKIISSYGETENRDWCVRFFVDAMGKYRANTGLFIDQAVILPDKEYDKKFGYPGTIPLSPWLYREYKAWDYIAKEMRKVYPKLHLGMGHFGNNQAPLFSNIADLVIFCEPGSTQAEYKMLQNRHPSLTVIKAVADGYRREMFWYHKERFLPYRFMFGNTDPQIGTHSIKGTEGEPGSQQCRYLFLQNLALHPNWVLLGFGDRTASGYYKATEQEFCKKWVAFAKENAKDLSGRVYSTSGEPSYGKVEVYSYGDKGNGWVFLVNPSMLSEKVTLSLNKELGFEKSGSYAIRELNPCQRWRLVNSKPSVEYGSEFELTVPGFEVTVLQLSPVQEAWKGQKRITVGAELHSGGGILAGVGESVEARVFDVSKPNKPVEISTTVGKVPGTPCRLDMKQWQVRAGGADANLHGGFDDGAAVCFRQKSEIGKTFSINDFAGVTMWNILLDPVLDRSVVDQTSLVSEKSDEQNISAGFTGDSDKGCWLSRKQFLSYVPVSSTMIVQIAVPERTQVKMWINGVEQKFMSSYNDWCVLQPEGISHGDNRIVVWIGPKQN